MNERESDWTPDLVLKHLVAVLALAVVPLCALAQPQPQDGVLGVEYFSHITKAKQPSTSHQS